MRIKEVCELTGLTDKAIRVYITNELIAPSYTENYAGRRYYSFDENDVEMLNKISLLRSFDFSISEIRMLFREGVAVDNVLENHIEEIKNVTSQSRHTLNSLLDVSVKGCRTPDELCLALSEAQSVGRMRGDTNDDFDIKGLVMPYVKKAKSKAPKIFLISVLAVLLGLIITSAVVFVCVKLFMNL